MAQKIIKTCVDDMDGVTEGAKTYTLVVNGEMIEIDLAPKNAKRLEKALQPFFEAGRRVPKHRQAAGGRKLPQRAGAGRRSTQASNDEIRAWARRQDPPMHVNERGRIPISVVQHYEAAHADRA